MKIALVVVVVYDPNVFHRLSNIAIAIETRFYSIFEIFCFYYFHSCLSLHLYEACIKFLSFSLFDNFIAMARISPSLSWKYAPLRFFVFRYKSSELGRFDEWEPRLKS